MATLEVVLRHCRVRLLGAAPPRITEVWRPKWGLVVSCRPLCAYREWPLDAAIPPRWREASDEEYRAARATGAKTIDELNRLIFPTDCDPEPVLLARAAPAAPPRPARVPRRARAARAPRPPRARRRSRWPRLPRTPREPREPRARRGSQKAPYYAVAAPRAGFITQGGPAFTTNPKFFRDEVIVCSNGKAFGPYPALQRLLASFKDPPVNEEQRARDYYTAHASADPLCGPAQTACQRVAGQVLSTIATLTGWQPAAPAPRPAPTAEERAEQQVRLWRRAVPRRLRRQMNRAAGPMMQSPPALEPVSAASPPPRVPPEFTLCLRQAWPGGVIHVPLGSP